MTSFDLFQRATCFISEGDYASAARDLRSAIAEIDATGQDADMRDDIAALLASVEVKA